MQRTAKQQMKVLVMTGTSIS